MDSKAKSYELASNPSETVFDAIQDFYNRSVFTDLKFFGYGHNSDYTEGIGCHKLVLESVSGVFQQVLCEDTDQIYLPDVSHEDVKRFLDSIYQNICSKKEPDWDDSDPDLLAFFRIPFDFESISMIRKVEQLEENRPLKGERRQKWVKHNFTTPKKPIEFREIHTQSSIELKYAWDSILFETATDQGFSSNFEEDHQGLKRRKKTIPRAENKSPSWRKKQKKQSLCVEALKSMINSREGTLEITESIPPMKVEASFSEIKNLTHIKDSFHVLMGIHEDELGFTGKPLAWTEPDTPNDVAKQFDDSIHVFSNVFGLSEADLLSGPHLLRRQAGKTPMSNTSDLQKRLYNKATRRELEDELKDRQLLAAYAAPSMTYQAITLPKTGWNIDLQPTLSLYHDVVLICIHTLGVECRQIQFIRDDSDLFSSVLTRVLYLVWSGGLQGSKIPRSDHIIDRYLRMKRITYIKKTAETLLATEGDLPRKLPTFTCDICGESIQENAHGTERAMHKRKHTIENMECSCQLGEMSFDEKKRHYLLVHSGWKVEQCSLCKWVGSKDAMERHKVSVHKKVMCDECGKLCFNAEKLKTHRQNMHKMFQCKECMEDFEGFSKLKHHLGRFHGGGEELLEQHRNATKSENRRGKTQHAKSTESAQFPCEQCRKTFKLEKNLKSHLKTTHETELDLPFQCKKCAKRFIVKHKLKYHLMNVHIRSRPFACRYEGCSSNFNNQSNLRQHEMKIHGGVHGRVASINDFVSDEAMLNLAEVIKPSHPEHSGS
ncbi:hypothetical protein TCAL_05045 [Tigriopus californicus]|uniref:BTB domain-containing protein n=1 Tax=Tigriopus californicus TaxID=6832 RepID=A0A553P8L7_TIGCA|nr:uncharacterized protein LOC131877848 [Tigriopus californicus]TRY74031.1 hypothetical protein TCAL_05045 [Tigriopus californicus]|eukprot:TCALIF_05045-PA protein Name:"Similar to ZNF358 Zinc finger protein 358 (Homo sapiens)" AED:0.64 eAED:0.64 QI:0/-1/0/1/-1/1/1/0/772